MTSPHERRRVRNTIRATLIAAAWATQAAGLLAAPFAEVVEFRQPDGTLIRLWGEGDEFHAVFETLDGYAVVFDAASRAYHFARLSADGADLVPTGALVGRADPASIGLPRHLRIRSDVARQRIRQRWLAWDQELGISERWRTLKANRLGSRSRPAAAAQAPGDTSAQAAGDHAILAPPSSPTLGTKVGLCLLIDFPDAPATIAASNLVELVNGDGFAGFGNNGSVKEYYQDTSNGLLLYTNVVTAYVRMNQPKSYYNDVTKPSGTQGRLLLNDALAILKALPNYESEILPRFDALTVDASNQAIACNVFFAGANSGVWSYGLWPHSSSLSPTVELSPGGKKVRRYQITQIGTSPTIGTFCHENGHMLCGFPDTYDYDQGADDSRGGTGRFCIMNTSGSTNPVQFCAYLKLAAGWATAIDLTSASFATGTLSSSGPAFNRFYRFGRPGVDTEYFLLENRQRAGRDATLPASGIAIWHIDELGDRDNQNLEPNPYHDNYEVTLEQADNLWHFQYNLNSGDSNDLYYAGNTAAAYGNEFSDGTGPSANWWDGTPSGAIFSDFGPSGVTMTFSIGGSIGVLPGDAMIYSGVAGGPFEPTTRALVVTNGTTHAFDWAIVSGQAWLDIAPPSGSLSPGAGASLTASPNASARALGRGTYQDMLIVSNLVTGQTVQRPIRIDVDIAIDWTDGEGGLWQDAAHWGPARAPAESLERISVTNAASKSVVVDATTASGAPGTMTISNLLLAGAPGTTNTLLFASPGTNLPFTVLNELIVAPGGRVSLSNAILRVGGAAGGSLSIDGGVDVFPGGLLSAASNDVLATVGVSNNGTLGVNGGSVEFRRAILGRHAGATGTLAIVAGSVSVETNSALLVGSNGVGLAILSGGEMRLGNGLVAGSRSGSRGIVEITGDHRLTATYVRLGDASGSAGSMLMDGGELLATNTTSQAGNSGSGDMIISNGVARFGSLTVGSGTRSSGSFEMSGGLCWLRLGLIVGSSANATGSVRITSGDLVATNNVTSYVGYFGSGELSVVGGTARFRSLHVGYTNAGRGLLDISGGTGLVASTLYVGWATNASGEVRVTGGALEATNTTYVGHGGQGLLSLAGGTARFGPCTVGYRPGPGGVIQVAGGTATFTSNLTLGAQAGSTGSLQVIGGLLLATNGTLTIGQSGEGRLTLSNGLLLARYLVAGVNAGALGEVAAEGGTAWVSSAVTLGNCPSGGSATLRVSGADVYVTNASHTGTLDARAGTVMVDAGSLTVDRLVVTGACARVALLGGTLNLGSAPILGAGMDADGDGLPNDWEQEGGLDPLVAVGEHGPAGDPDRDGYDNGSELLGGSDPGSGGSFPRAAAVHISGNDVIVLIQSIAGRHYQLQAGGLSGPDDWTDVGAPVPGTGELLNLAHPGGADHPARFYRIRID